ncbi:GNAT family N-acetyltransferase [Streptomyces sp. NPDC001500]
MAYGSGCGPVFRGGTYRSSVAPARKKGEITILAVSNRHRRHHVGATLREHAFEQMRALGAEVVEIGTGGDQFHAPARALYEALGCTALPLTVYFRQP